MSGTNSQQNVYIAVRATTATEVVAATDDRAQDRSPGFGAFRHLGFRVYFAGMLVRGTAVWMQLVSLPWAAVEAGASAGELGVITALQFLPTLVISPIGGVMADRWDRARILLLTQVGSALQGLGLSLVVLADASSIPVLALFAVTFGTLTAIELPVRQSFVPDLAPEAEVTSAVSLHSTAWNTTRFIGPGAAGIVIATYGVAASFLVSAVGAALVTISIAWLARHPVHARPRDGVRHGVRSALRDGARFAFGVPRIRAAIVMASAGNILGIQVFLTLAPLFVASELGLGGGAFGALMAAWGGGAVLASYVVTIAARDRRRWMERGSLGLAISVAVFGRLDAAAPAFALAGILGFMQIALIQNAILTVQLGTPDALRGRVLGLYTTVFQGTGPAGAVIGGLAAEAIGLRDALLFAAVALAVVWAVVAVTMRPAGPPAPGR